MYMCAEMSVSVLSCLSLQMCVFDELLCSFFVQGGQITIWVFFTVHREQRYHQTEIHIVLI